MGIKMIINNEQYPLKRFVLYFNCGKPLYASSPKTGGGKAILLDIIAQGNHVAVSYRPLKPKRQTSYLPIF